MQGVAHFLQGPSRSVPGWRQGSRTCSDVQSKGISFTIVRSILRRSTPLGPSPPLLEAPGPSFRTPSPHLPWTPPRTSPGPPPWSPGGGSRDLKNSSKKSSGKFVEKKRREIRQEIRREFCWGNLVRIFIFGKFVEKIRPGLEGGMNDLQRISHTLKKSSKHRAGQHMR